MNTVTLLHDGSLLRGSTVFDGDPLILLGNQVELDHKFRLKSYFFSLEKYPVFQRINPFISSLLERFRSIPHSDDPQLEDEFLELGKTVEMIGFPGKPRLEIFNTLRLVISGSNLEIKHFLFDDLVQRPLRIGHLKHIVFGDKVDIFNFETVFNLFEFLDGLAWELSFHGTPVQCALRR